MADEKPPSKMPGWLKGVCTSGFGLVSGAALMYLTPLVNTVIKPAKPVANFAQQTQSLTVTFNNRSTGGTQGWWDFGDGTALEPYELNKDTVTHTYARPGSYSVKLSLQNLLGEQAERAVTVNLDNSSAAPPSIDVFTVVPLTPTGNAPATFKIVSQVKNARLVAWDLGDQKLKTEKNLSPEKYVTIDEPGYYRLRLVAFNGDEVTEKSQEVFVGMGAESKPTATVTVIYDGVQVDQKTERQSLVLAWNPKQQGPTCPVSRELTVDAGWTIGDVKYEPPVKDTVRALKFDVSPDKTRLRVSGELTRTKSPLAKSVAPPQCVVRLDMTLVRRSAPLSKTSDVVAFEVTAPGSTPLPLPPPPAGMEVVSKGIALEIKDGKQVLWNSPGLPAAAQVAMKNRTMRVTAVEQGNQLRLDIIEAKGAIPVSRPGG